MRTVGYEDPETHQLVWFNLKRGPLHYVPSIGLYFKLHQETFADDMDAKH